MSLGLEDARYYPLSEINEVTDRTHTINNSVTANFDYIIGSGFDLSFGGIYERSVTDIKHYASGNSSEARQYINSAVTQDNTGNLTFNIPEGGFLKQQHDNLSSYTLRAQLNYNKVIGSQHSFNAILGTEVRQVIDEGNIASYFGYDDQTLLQQPVDYGSLFSGNVTGAFLVPYLIHPIILIFSTSPIQKTDIYLAIPILFIHLEILIPLQEVCV